MDLLDLVWVCIVSAVLVIGTHELVKYLQVPQPFMWAVPLAVFGLIAIAVMVLVVKQFWQ